jgi:hypothetical protein
MREFPKDLGYSITCRIKTCQIGKLILPNKTFKEAARMFLRKREIILIREEHPIKKRRLK